MKIYLGFRILNLGFANYLQKKRSHYWKRFREFCFKIHYYLRNL